MQGTMRFASLDSTSGPNEAFNPRKRSIGALERKGNEDPANFEFILDINRAALSRHHVRTLNSQFASWVQAQLADHPDELWEDGVTDYISHARDIMEKFRDVVNWLKENATKANVAAQSKAETVSFDMLSKENCDQSLPTNSTKATSGWNPIPLSTNQSSALLTNSHSSNILISPNLSTGLNSSSQNTLHTSSGSSLQSSGTAFTPHCFGSLPSIQNSAKPPNTSVLFDQNSLKTVPSTQTGVNDATQISGTAFTPHNFGSLPSIPNSAKPPNPPVFFGQNSLGKVTSTQTVVNDATQSSGTAFTLHSFGSLPSSAKPPNTPVLFGTVASTHTSVNDASQSSGTAFTPHSFGSLPSIQTSAKPPNTSVLFGQNSLGTAAGTQSAVNDEDEMAQPSSPSLKKSEEKGILTVHEVKCKVYVKASDPTDTDTWKDKGTGQLLIKCKEGVNKGSKDSKPTIVIRNDAGKILLNALLYPGIKTNVQKNSLVAIFHTAESDGESSNVVARTYLLRTKSSEDIAKLQTIICEYAPPS